MARLSTTVVSGDVGSVRAAVEAGSAAASQVGELVRKPHHRPSERRSGSGFFGLNAEAASAELSAKSLTKPAAPVKKFSPHFDEPHSDERSDRVLILVANLGSTSFKYRLLDMSDERELARGAVDRIGEPVSKLTVSAGDWKDSREQSVPDHGVAVAACLEQLTDPEHGVIASADEVAAIGFKAVHGGRLSGVNPVDDDVLEAMAEMNSAAPAHNPPYIAAMKTLGERFPQLPMVASFETGFHATIPASRRTYAIPPIGPTSCRFAGTDFTVPVTVTSAPEQPNCWVAKMPRSFLVTSAAAARSRPSIPEKAFSPRWA